METAMNYLPLSEVISRVKMRFYRKKDKRFMITFGIHPTHIKQNCSIFGFTCPLRDDFSKDVTKTAISSCKPF